MIPAADRPRSWRTPATYQAYALLACLGFAVDGLGGILLPLQDELDVSAGTLALVPSMYALGFVLIGTLGRPLVDRLGDHTTMALAAAVFAGGALLAWLPSRYAVLAGIAAFGLASALAVVAVPALLAEQHPTRTRVAVTEANALSVLAGIAAPLAVAAALAAQVGWRVGYLVPIAVLGLLIIARRTRADVTVDSADEMGERRVGLGAQLVRWSGVVLSVMVEFAFVLWAAAASQAWHGASPPQAAWAPSVFIAGMATGRFAGAALDHRVSVAALRVASVALVLAGFAGFWLTTGLYAGYAWLLVAGLGVASLYPVTLTELVTTSPTPSAGGRWGAVASGTAIILSPQLLGRLADASSLRSAFLLIPVLTVLLAVQHAASSRAATKHAVSRA